MVSRPLIITAGTPELFESAQEFLVRPRALVPSCLVLDIAFQFVLQVGSRRHLAPAGQRVAVVERRYIGGSCPNIACMPSVIAFSRSGDPSLGEFEDAVILARYGDTPSDLAAFMSV